MYIGNPSKSDGVGKAASLGKAGIYTSTKSGKTGNIRNLGTCTYVRQCR